MKDDYVSVAWLSGQRQQHRDRVGQGACVNGDRNSARQEINCKYIKLQNLPLIILMNL